MRNQLWYNLVAALALGGFVYLTAQVVAATATLESQRRAASMPNPDPKHQTGVPFRSWVAGFTAQPLDQIFED